MFLLECYPRTVSRAEGTAHLKALLSPQFTLENQLEES